MACLLPVLLSMNNTTPCESSSKALLVLVDFGELRRVIILGSASSITGPNDEGCVVRIMLTQDYAV